MTRNTVRRLVSNNTDAKCEYKCNDGYELRGQVCAKAPVCKTRLEVQGWTDS